MTLCVSVPLALAMFDRRHDNGLLLRQSKAPLPRSERCVAGFARAMR